MRFSRLIGVNNCEEISATRRVKNGQWFLESASSLKRNQAGMGLSNRNLFMRANISLCRDFSTMMTIILWFHSMRHSTMSLFILFTICIASLGVSLNSFMPLQIELGWRQMKIEVRAWKRWKIKSKWVKYIQSGESCTHIEIRANLQNIKFICTLHLIYWSMVEASEWERIKYSVELKKSSVKNKVMKRGKSYVARWFRWHVGVVFLFLFSYFLSLYAWSFKLLIFILFFLLFEIALLFLVYILRWSREILCGFSFQLIRICLCFTVE